MAKEFTLDLQPLENLIKKSPLAAAAGGKQALDDIKDDWVRQSRDIAPLDSRNLHDQIDGKVEGNGFKSEVVISANAKAKSGTGDFNYAYYIHEQDAGGKQLRHPGTVKKFLDESADERLEEWQRWLEDGIAEALKREGW
ncbi:hypothetical protein MHI39_20190 [Heyndrickxia sp. FSL K6-6286]|uniref:hypothetical protein n=1 Tax=Heyndrickxia sp. FSL K6-6286 TaxID=2921510 RepID=UPI0015D220BB|nr:hypothetical protein [Bacillus sp. Gen3]